MAGVQIDGVNNKIDFDDDLDTSISANTDDTLIIEAGGNTMATITATTLTINDGTTITTADNTDNLTLKSTDTDANIGPNLRLYRAVAGAASDAIGTIDWAAQDVAGNLTDYASAAVTITDATDGSEDATLTLKVMNAGALNQMLTISGPETVVNEGSKDHDFRVESNGNTHMLFVDGGNDKVGISTSSPGRTLSIGNDGIIGLEGSQNAIAFTDSSTLRAYVTSGAFGDHNGDGLGIVTATGEPIKFFTNGGERMRIDSTGAVTKPSQPAFLAIISGTQSNIANGNTIAFGTEVYDQNADFASSTFTAPVTGKYQFNFLISVTELDFDATFHRVQLVTSNRTFNFDIKSSQHYTADPNYATFDGSMCVDMDASDTAVLKWSQSAGNSSSDVFDSTYFSGHLAC